MNLPSFTIDNEVQLLPIKKEDALPIFNAIDKNRSHLRTWLPFVDFTKNSDNTLTYINSVLDDPSNKQIVYTIQKCNCFIGLVGLKDIDYVNQKLEIGYWLVEKEIGKGIMTKSVLELINFAFKNLDINRIQIKCGTENYKSFAIPERLGFTFEGIERAGEFHQDFFIDLNTYSLLKSEWIEKDQFNQA